MQFTIYLSRLSPFGPFWVTNEVMNSFSLTFWQCRISEPNLYKLQHKTRVSEAGWVNCFYLQILPKLVSVHETDLNAFLTSDICFLKSFLGQDRLPLRVWIRDRHVLFYLLCDCRYAAKISQKFEKFQLTHNGKIYSYTNSQYLSGE